MNEAKSPGFRRELNVEQKRLAWSSWPMIAAYIVVSTVAYAYLDLYAYESHALYGLVGVLMWGAGYFLFLTVMQRGGYLATGKKTGIGTYFALSVGISIFVGLALVFLILPGLYLLMRWLPAYSRALVTNDGVGNSMRWAWASTELFEQDLAIAMIGPTLCFAMTFGSWLIYAQYYEFIGWTGFGLASLVWNGSSAIALAWFTVLGVAAFGVLSARAQGSAPSDESDKTA